jgi:predicted metalloprotease with PDZ domain
MMSRISSHHSIPRWGSAALIVFGAATIAPIQSNCVWASDPPPTIKLMVDATDAPRSILHANLVIPVKPGPLTLYYPEWIPGEHMPDGPIVNLAGLKFSAGGKALPWRRDLVDMFAFHLDVPEGVSTIDVALDFLLAGASSRFSSGASATSQLDVLSWNQVLLYPQGWPVNELQFESSLRIPEGWKFGTALPIAKRSGSTIEFAPVALETLIDSPVLSGAHFRVVPLTPDENQPHEIDIAADSPAALEMKPDDQMHYKQLVAQADALFGSRHYRDYHFLLTLSDDVAHFGLEHHESSDDRVAERTLLDNTLRLYSADLLPHEFVHSWNGKFRRPAGLATSDYQQPMKGNLLWVYEGLTQYLGLILATRSGLWTPPQFLEQAAFVAATFDHRAGRTWRPLQDTADAAQLLYAAPEEWTAWRRSVDFYEEGSLIWLEADTIIRQQTKGRRSLDDFCRPFFGGPGGAPAVKTYTFDDVVAALNAVAPSGWREFFTARLTSLNPHAPLGGIENGGWRLIYNETRNENQIASEVAHKLVDLSFSIGLVVEEDGAIRDVIPGMAAAAAGIGPGMKLQAVNGRQWSPEFLRQAIEASKATAKPLELLIANGNYFRTYALNYHDGLRYPHLERDSSHADLLSAIIKPLVPRGAITPR